MKNKSSFQPFENIRLGLSNRDAAYNEQIVGVSYEEI